jgi:glutathione peroxidase
MKHILVVLFVFFIFNQGKSQQLMNFYDLEAVTIEGDTISMSQYAGKKLLVVNTASYCGYTHQFNDLEALYLQYGGAGFEIIGFPCNDFGSQDPGSDSTILDFCTNNYNVTFQMMSRISIKMGDTSAVYKWLQRGNLNGVSDAAVTWNFNKFLIDAEGNWAGYYDSPVAPGDAAIVNWINEISPAGLSNIYNEKTQVWYSQNTIHIKIPNSVNGSQFKLFSISGQEISISKGSNAGELIPNSELQSGIYLLQQIQNDKQVSHRFVVMK